MFGRFPGEFFACPDEAVCSPCASLRTKAGLEQSRRDDLEADERWLECASSWDSCGGKRNEALAISADS